MEALISIDGEAVESLLHVLEDDLIASHDGGRPTDGAIERCGELTDKLEHTQAFEVKASCASDKSDA
jgi:hypothetical protein